MRTRPYILTAALSALLMLAVFVGAAAAQDAGRVITPSSVGDALVGSTVDELSVQLGENFEISDEVRVTVDFTGHVVSSDGQVQFRAIKASAPGDELSLIIVNNDDYATAEGVGPGTTIAEAEAIYGEATLRWNPDDESREFVEFENQPEGRIAFRTPGIGGTNVGIYADGAMETSEYEPDAMIAAVWISCVPGTDCAADLAAADGADDADGAASDGADAADGADEAEGASGEADGADGADEAEGASDDADPGSLPVTGFEEVVLLSVAAALLMLGGGFVLIQRSYLAPNWLSSRRW